MYSERLARTFTLIFTQEQLERISIVDDGSLTVIVDLHGYSRIEARRFTMNIINAGMNVPFSLDIIHGFHRGTVLKSMLAEDLCSKRIQGIVVDESNPGLTHLMLA